MLEWVRAKIYYKMFIVVLFIMVVTSLSKPGQNCGNHTYASVPTCSSAVKLS